MHTAGIIFSNLHDQDIPELTEQRTMASVPFGCRYRMIDFALSNMVNSGIKNVHVITHYNYRSLMEHIGSGKDWDLARRSGGIKILPPFITAYANSTNSLYDSRLEALKSIYHTISDIEEDYVVLSDCDSVCNINIRDMLEYHIRANADITLAVKETKLTKSSAAKNTLIFSDSEGILNDIAVRPKNFSGKADINLNIWIVTRRYLTDAVLDSIAHGYDSFSRDIIAKNINKRNYRIYRFDGYYANITSLEDYFAHSMDMLDKETREKVFNVPDHPVLTKTRNSAPTVYCGESKVNDSLIADGCKIEGTVENSILFRGVKIGKNAIVRNSILFQDTFVGENAFVNCVVADKNTVIKSGSMLSGHQSKPYYTEKGKIL